MTLVDPELAGRVLERALARGGDVAELYAESRGGFALSLDDRRVERPQSGRERGACASPRSACDADSATRSRSSSASPSTWP